MICINYSAIVASFVCALSSIPLLSMVFLAFWFKIVDMVDGWWNGPWALGEANWLQLSQDLDRLKAVDLMRPVAYLSPEEFWRTPSPRLENFLASEAKVREEIALQVEARRNDALERLQAEIERLQKEVASLKAAVATPSQTLVPGEASPKKASRAKDKDWACWN